MNVYDNFVYLTICEISLPMMKRTNYSTYGAYCRGVGWGIKHGVLSGKEKDDIATIFGRLNLIFGMSNDETADYIDKYFSLDMFKNYERSVRLTKEYFPFTGD